MRTLTAPETAALLTGVAHHRIEMKRPEDAAWTNLSAVYGGDWGLSIRVEAETVDGPVGRFSVVLLKKEGAYATAPGISASPLNIDAALEYRPLVYPGSHIRVYSVKLAPGVVPAPGDLRLWLEGRVEDADWPEDTVATCTTLDGILEETQIEVEEIRGAADPGTPIEDEIQGLLDRWMGVGVVPLRVIGTPDWGVGEYTPAIGSLGAQIRALAQENAWDVRYLWSEADDAYRYTLYLPPRDKDTIDLALTKADILAVPGLKVSKKYVRNAFSGEAVASDGTLITATDQDAASILAFGRLWMGIREGAKSIIKTLPQLQTLLGYAKSDLSQPPVEKKIQIPFIPWLTLHDRVSYAADGINWDFPTEYSIVGISHEVPEGAEPFTELDLRAGNPVGMYYAWRARRGAVVEASEISILSLDEVEKTDTYTDLQVVTGARVESIFVFDSLWTLPITGSTLPSDPTQATTILAPGDVYRVEVAPQGSERRVYFAPYSGSGEAGPIELFKMGPALQSDPWFERLNEAQGADTLHSDLTLRVRDPQGLGGILYARTNKASSSDAATTDTPTSLVIASTPATITPADLDAFNEVTVHPGRGKKVYLEFVNTNGATTGVQDFYLHGWTTVVTLADELRDASVKRATILDGAVNDLKLADLAVTNAKVATAAIDAAKIASDAVTAVKIAAGAVEEAKVAAGAITEAKLGDRAATSVKIALGAIIEELVAASAITTTKISDSAISTPKLAAGAVTAVKIAAGTITANEIAAGTILAANIAAGTITGTQIAGATITAAKLVAGTITSAEIAAGTITGGNIAAGTITAGNIAASTITSSQIASLTILAGNIAAGTITGDKVAATTITGSNIVGLTITGDKISASTITADKITVSSLSAITANLGTITAGQVVSAGGATGMAFSGMPGVAWAHYVNLTGTGYFLYSKPDANVRFSLDYDGNLYLKGEVHATAGTFAGTVTAAAVVAATSFTGTTLFLPANGTVNWSPAGIGDFPGLIWTDTLSRTASITTSATGFMVATAPSLRIQDSGRSLGFFGATPVAKPTGVAVSAADIHAALVSLGLIAA